jgi:hypothetical protein
MHPKLINGKVWVPDSVFGGYRGNFRRTIQSTCKSYIGLIVRGLLNFWTGFTTERNLKESSEEGNDHLSARLGANLGHHLSKTTHTVLEALIAAFKAIVIALIEVLKLATGGG